MKSHDDIQKAHDILVSVILGQTPLNTDSISEALLKESANVLCWVLEHPSSEENEGFGVALKDLEDTLAEYGWRVVDNTELLSSDELEDLAALERVMKRGW